MSTILIVEDDSRIQKALQRLFTAEGYEVKCATDGTAGLEIFQAGSVEAVVLDLMLPGLSGRELCKIMKRASPDIPVIILSAVSEVADKVLLLELGADDYVTKPFSPKELLARVRRAMRRGAPKTQHVTNVAAETVEHEVLTFSDVQIDFTSMEAARGGKALTLTAQEFKLLKFFARSPGRVISREELLNEVWGYENYPTTRTVDNHILRLRQKLEPDPANPRFFLTIHGAGYKFTTSALVSATEK